MEAGRKAIDSLFEVTGEGLPSDTLRYTNGATLEDQTQTRVDNAVVTNRT